MLEMNDRINNLIDQSGFGSYAEIPDTYVVHKNDLAEFAELIVKECAQLARDTNLEDVEGGDSDVLRAAKQQILEHFGVEE